MFSDNMMGVNSGIGIATQSWFKPRPDPRGVGFMPSCAAGTEVAASSALWARAAKTELLHLLALCLLWFSEPALAERDVTITRDADTIRIDAKLRVDVHHHLAWQVLTDYDNLARFVPGLLTSRIVSEPGAPLLLKQTGRSGLLWLTVPVEVVVRIEEMPLEAISFFAVSGTLKSKSGEWRIEAQDDATLLIYRASIVPGFWVPPLIGTAVMAQDVRGKLVGVANEMTRRAASAKSEKL